MDEFKFWKNKIFNKLILEDYEKFLKDEKILAMDEDLITFGMQRIKDFENADVDGDRVSVALSDLVKMPRLSEMDKDYISISYPSLDHVINYRH